MKCSRIMNPSEYFSFTWETFQGDFHIVELSFKKKKGWGKIRLKLVIAWMSSARDVKGKIMEKASSYQISLFYYYQDSFMNIIYINLLEKSINPLLSSCMYENGPILLFAHSHGLSHSNFSICKRKQHAHQKATFVDAHEHV